MKHLTSIILLSLFGVISNCQVVTTLDISGGYNIPIAREDQAIDRHEVESSTFPYYYTTYVKVKGISYGTGGNLALNINVYSKKNIGGGIKLNTFFGHKFSSLDYLNGLGGDASMKSKTSVFSFQFIPHLCFRHDFKVVNPVIEAGMIIGMARIRGEAEINYSSPHYIINTTVIDYGNVLLGFYSSLGLEFNVSKVVKINVALICNVASYSPSKWKRTQFLVDGVDQFSNLYASSKTGEYVPELDLQAAQSNYLPSKNVKYFAALSSVGFNAGICFRFPPKAKKTEKKKKNPDAIQSF